MENKIKSLERINKIDNYITYLGETSLKNSQAWRRKSEEDRRKPQLLGNWQAHKLFTKNNESSQTIK